jgi:CBS domain-containing protein
MCKLKQLAKLVVTVPYSMNIAGVAVTMDLHNTHCVLVEHVDSSLGIITEKDIIRNVVARCKDPSQIRAWEIMKQPIITADEETEMRDAIEIMKQNRVRNIIVTRGKEIVGVVKRSTILNNIKFDENSLLAQQALVKENIQPTVSDK